MEIREGVCVGRSVLLCEAGRGGGLRGVLGRRKVLSESPKLAFFIEKRAVEVDSRLVYNRFLLNENF